MRRPASSIVEAMPRPGQLPVGAVRLFKSRPATWSTTPVGACVGEWMLDEVVTCPFTYLILRIKIDRSRCWIARGGGFLRVGALGHLARLAVRALFLCVDLTPCLFPTTHISTLLISHHHLHTIHNPPRKCKTRRRKIIYATVVCVILLLPVRRWERVVRHALWSRFVEYFNVEVGCVDRTPVTRAHILSLPKHVDSPE